MDLPALGSDSETNDTDSSTLSQNQNDHFENKLESEKEKDLKTIQNELAEIAKVKMSLKHN